MPKEFFDQGGMSWAKCSKHNSVFAPWAECADCEREREEKRDREIQENIRRADEEAKRRGPEQGNPGSQAPFWYH